MAFFESFVRNSIDSPAGGGVDLVLVFFFSLFFNGIQQANVIVDWPPVIWCFACNGLVSISSQLQSELLNNRTLRVGREDGVDKNWNKKIRLITSEDSRVSA